MCASQGGERKGEKTPIEELTAERIAKRMKKIEFGKNTAGYKNYVARVPKSARMASKKNSIHPVTPDAHEKCSKRKFDGIVSRWRRRLHIWDDDVDEAEFARRVRAEEALHTPRKKAKAHETPIGKRRKRDDGREEAPRDTATAPMPTDAGAAAALAPLPAHALPAPGDTAYAQNFPLACGLPASSSASASASNGVSALSASAAATGGATAGSFYEALTKNPAPSLPPPSSSSSMSAAATDDGEGSMTDAMSDVNTTAAAADSANSAARRQLNYDSTASEFGGGFGDTMSIASSSAFSSSATGGGSLGAGIGAGAGANAWEGDAPPMNAFGFPTTSTTATSTSGGAAPRAMLVSNNDSVMSSFELNLNDPDDEEEEEEAAGAGATSSASTLPALRPRQPSFAEVVGGGSSPTFTAASSAPSSRAVPGAGRSPTVQPIADGDNGNTPMSFAQSGNTPPPLHTKAKAAAAAKPSYASAVSAKK